MSGFSFISFSTASRLICGMRITHEINSLNTWLQPDRWIPIQKLVLAIGFERSWTNFVIYCCANLLVAQNGISAPSLDCNWTPMFCYLVPNFCHWIGNQHSPKTLCNQYRNKLTMCKGDTDNLILTLWTVSHKLYHIPYSGYYSQNGGFLNSSGCLFTRDVFSVLALISFQSQTMVDMWQKKIF